MAKRIALFWRLSSGTRAGRAQGILRVWPLWERIARRIWWTVPVPGAPYGVFAVHRTRYHGQPIALADGTVIREPDAVVELHLNGAAVACITSRQVWDLLPAARADLHALAAWLQDSPSTPEIKGLFAVTVLGSGARRLGFTVRERPVTLRARLDRFFLTGLLALYSERGIERLASGKTPGAYPREIWMSRDELLRRYADAN